MNREDAAAMSPQNIRKRHRNLSDIMIRTLSVILSPRHIGHIFDDADIYMKLENLQETGTFKARGALSVARSVPQEAYVLLELNK